MRTIGLAATIIVGALFAIATPAFAKPLPSSGLTRADVLKWLQGRGMKAKLDYDEVAKDSTVAVDAGDTNWSIYFYNCGGEHCKSIQYAAGWKGDAISVDQINLWNNNRRFLRAYKNNSGYVFAEFDVDVIPGGTWELVDYSLDRWNKQLAVFEKFLSTGKIPND